MYNVYSSCGFQQGDIIGITSSTCRHYTLINSIMCSDSYPIPILSLFFLYHPYIPPFLIRRIFHFLVSFLFLLHACMYSHQAYNSNGGYHVICKSIFPFIMYYGSVLLLFTRKVHRLHTFEHMSALLAIKV